MRVEEVVAGETYMIRYWDEMESEFGSKTECGCMMIDTPDGPNFVSGMKKNKWHFGDGIRCIPPNQ